MSWIAAAGAVAALGVGAYGLHTQRTKGEAFDNYPTGSPTKTCGANRPDKGGTACKSLYNQAQTGKQLMIGGMAAGGALAAAAIVGFIISSSDGNASDAPAEVSLQGPRVSLNAGSFELGWSMRF